jgi:hypothetical protein
VSVPDVVGMSPTRAWQDIRQAGLCLGQVTFVPRRSSNRHPPGTDSVVAMTPPFGTRMHRRALVSFTDDLYMVTPNLAGTGAGGVASLTFLMRKNGCPAPTFSPSSLLLSVKPVFSDTERRVTGGVKARPEMG